MGSGADQQARVRTAADAAALAALSEIRNDNGLGDLGLLDLVDDAGSLGDILGGLGGLTGNACSAARDYAGRNGAEVTSCSVQLDLPYIVSDVTVRSLDPVEDTEIKLDTDAVARMNVRGLCRGPGGSLGLDLTDGGCLTLGSLGDFQPPPPDEDEDDGEDEDAEEDDDAEEPEPPSLPGIGGILFERPVLIE